MRVVLPYTNCPVPNIVVSCTPVLLYPLRRGGLRWKHPGVTILKIVSSIKISNDMTCNVVVNVYILTKLQLEWILPQNVRITRWSQIENILTRYKKDNIEKLSETVEDIVSLITNNFLHLIDVIKHDIKYSDTNTSNQLNFLLAQFNLIFSKSHRYSIQTKIWSCMIFMQSVSAYQSIRETNLNYFTTFKIPTETKFWILYFTHSNVRK